LWFRSTATLGTAVADTYTLYLKTHAFHWKVTGPMFQTLHLLFETQYNELWAAVDTIAERIRALGEPAPGSYTQFAKLSSVPEETGTPKAGRSGLWLRGRQLAGFHAGTERTRFVAAVAEGLVLGLPAATEGDPLPARQVEGAALGVLDLEVSFDENRAVVANHDARSCHPCLPCPK
jgi:hypothetical protein